MEMDEPLFEAEEWQIGFGVGKPPRVDDDCKTDSFSWRNHFV
jgi:hypothetical protein